MASGRKWKRRERVLARAVALRSQRQERVVVEAQPPSVALARNS
jgi:hypothetical protein